MYNQSLCCTPETNTIFVNQLYFNKKNNNFKKKEIWIGDLAIWHEITQEKVCGVKREDDLGQNSKELQQQRDKECSITETEGTGRVGRYRRTVTQKPRGVSITQRR